MDSRPKYRNRRKCSVPGCSDISSKRHRFPRKNPEIMQAWLNSIKNTVLQQMDFDDIYKSHLVCNMHFDEKSKVIGTKRGLTMDAVPTLHLPSISEDTLSDSSIKIEVYSLEEIGETAGEKFNGIYEDVLEDCFYNIDSPIMPENRPPSQEKSSTSIVTNSVEKKRSIARDAKIAKQWQLALQYIPLYMKVFESARQIRTLNKRISTFKRKLHYAQEMLKSILLCSFHRYPNKNKGMYAFNFKKLPMRKLKSRSYTLEEKTMCLTLLKAGGSGYSLLSKIFPLPSKQTLIACQTG